MNFGADGGSGNVIVQGGDSGGCTWTATSSVTWISISGNSSGDGNITYTVAVNTGATARAGTITVAGQNFTINQAAGCVYTPTLASANILSTGGTGSVTVNRSNASCSAPSATSNVSWITPSVNNSGNVTYTVAGNTGPGAREGIISISGEPFRIIQAACTYALSTASGNPASSGGTYNFSVTPSSPTCYWVATSDSPSWMTTATGSYGTGGGTVNYSVTANSGNASRTGTITVANQAVTVTQPGCTYTLSPTSSGAISISGGTYNFTITASGRI